MNEESSILNLKKLEILWFILSACSNRIITNHDMRMLKGSWSAFYKSILVLRVTIIFIYLVHITWIQMQYQEMHLSLSSNMPLRVSFGLHFMVFRPTKPWYKNLLHRNIRLLFMKYSLRYSNKKTWYSTNIISPCCLINFKQKRMNSVFRYYAKLRLSLH